MSTCTFEIIKLLKQARNANQLKFISQINDIIYNFSQILIYIFNKLIDSLLIKNKQGIYK